MSWLDKIKSDLIIKTGDGKEYKPLWVNASKTKEYNIAEFEFVNVSGALIKRSKPKAARFDLQLFFQGSDHLDISAAFEKSADDHREWTLTHPYYGLLIVQPVSIDIDNTKHNVSSIKVPVIETITETFPKASTNPKEQIDSLVSLGNETIAANTTATIAAKWIEPSTVSKFKAFIDRVDSYNQRIINSLSNTEEYFNALNQAQSNIDNLTNTLSAAPLAAMQTTQKVLCAPALFTTKVKDRISTLITSFTDAATGVANSLSTLNLMDKVLFQANGGSLIGAICLAASTPLPNDYGNMDDVLAVMDDVLDNYNIYTTTLASTQTPDGGESDSFIPDPLVLQQISQLVSYTVSNLFTIALSAKQQRSIILEDDSNWILLAYRFYGLNADDTTIQALIKQNNAGLNEMLQVPKNRKIIYYN